jgi:N-acetyl-gamma-glutamyl-phosphate reductase
MKTAVVGASGYAGGELLRLLSAHPKFEIVYIAAGSNAGELITSVHPQLSTFNGQKFASTEVAKINECELIL